MSDEKPVRILRALFVEHYHNLPSDLEMVTVDPEQAAIFQYLSQIDPGRFQDFVSDVLVLTEGHHLIDVTGGPGDEKQDILTEAPEGHRQLAQCKHTIHYETKSTGDELDLLFAAAFRKNCKVALYVTNGDLTPQAKRYINDREYLRGSSENPANVPAVEYWNGRRIWNRIAGNSQILNKWFSGAAQVHGLRSVSVRLITTEMPDRIVRECSPESVKSVFEAMGTSFAISVDRWFSTRHDVPGAATHLPPDAPVFALNAQITEKSGIGLFHVDAAVMNAARATLTSLGTVAGWLHQFVSAPSSVFMVHDLRRPMMSEVGSARSFVQVGNEIEDEFVWSFDPGSGFDRRRDGELAWIHPASGAEWHVAVNQRIGPHEAYGAVFQQQQLIRAASNYKFWRLGFSQRNLELLLSLRIGTGIVLTEGEENLLLALAMPEFEHTAKQLEAFCTRNQVPYEILSEEERRSIISKIEELPQSDSKWVSHLRELESPVDLTGRLVSLVVANHTSISGDPALLMNLLKYKIDYEAKWGFDAYKGQAQLKIGSEELSGRLLDLNTIRGSRMLDIGLRSTKELLLLLRRQITNTSKASSIASEMLVEIGQIYNDLSSLSNYNQELSSSTQ